MLTESVSLHVFSLLTLSVALQTAPYSGAESLSRILESTLLEREQSFAEACQNILRYHKYYESPIPSDSVRALPLILTAGAPGVGKVHCILLYRSHIPFRACTLQLTSVYLVVLVADTNADRDCQAVA